MANVNREDVVFYLSTATAESPYGTADAVDRKIRPTPVLPVHVAEIDTDEPFATGYEGPVDSQLLTKHYTWSPEIRHVRPDDMAIFLGLICGTPTSAVADTSAYLHKFGLSSSRTLPSCTLEYVKTDSVQRKLAGGVASQVNISIAANQFATISPQMCFASDASGSGSASFSAETVVCNGANLGMNIGSAAEAEFIPALGADDITSPSDISADFVSLDLTLVNFRSPKAAMFDARSSAPVMGERGPRLVTARLTIETDDQTELDYIQAQTETALELEWDSDVLAGAATQNYGWQFVFPKVRFMSYGDSWDELGRLRQAFDLMLFEDATLGRMQAAVWNQTAAYFA